ncbi:hypothetical protein RZS08_13305, partial [Arthrospira platensis SPKY1]|nr:hypothetical protein [Arthrospira platensis SPKY1]
RLLPIEAPTYNARWGSARGFGSAWTPSVQTWLVATEAGEAKVEVRNAKGLVLHNQQLAVTKGLNALTYDLSVDASVVSTWLKTFAKDAPKAADNGAYYLPADTYTLRVTLGKATTETKLEVKKPRERPARKAQKKTP